MRYVELFAGVGGFRLGIEQAISYTECVFSNEWDKYAAQTYDKNFKGKIDTTDIRHISAEHIADHDCLVGGFPCQAFSVAGKRQGFEETRGTLFFEIARILADKRPRHLVLENVKGLLTHDGGKTFKTILGVLADLGYRVEWQVLNSRSFGVPQYRDRVFIVGHLRADCRSQIFPIIGNTTTAVRAVATSFKDDEGKRKLTATKQFSTVTSTYYKGAQSGGRPLVFDSRGKRTRIYDNYTQTLKANMGTGGNNMPLVAPNGKMIDLTDAPPNSPFQLFETRTEQGKQSRSEIRKREGRDSTLRSKDDKKYIPKTDGLANTLTTGAGNPEKLVIEPAKQIIRRLTPVECERLQGFPDNWTAGVSDTQRYKQMGNAVTVNVIKAIFERLNTQCKLNK